jgi:hypothetical protein
MTAGKRLHRFLDCFDCLQRRSQPDAEIVGGEVSFIPPSVVTQTHALAFHVE